MSALIVLPVPPALNHYYRVFRGRTVIGAEGRAYRDHALWLLAQQWPHAPLSGDVDVLIVWYRARRAGDVDGRLKCLLDVLSGVVYADDRQIRRLSIERRDDDAKNSRVEIVVQSGQTN